MIESGHSRHFCTRCLAAETGSEWNDAYTAAGAQPRRQLRSLMVDLGALVMSALVAGAKAGRADAADPAVKDTYDRLKLMIFPVVITVAEYEKDPDAWQVPLTKALDDSGVADSPQLIETAQELLALLGKG
jgi:hypothetical protein